MPINQYVRCEFFSVFTTRKAKQAHTYWSSVCSFFLSTGSPSQHQRNPFSPAQSFLLSSGFLP